MKLIILDRDGVINEDSDNYIKSPAEWVPIQGSLEAIGRLKSLNYTVAIATNQSGVGRGYYDLKTLFAMHEKMVKLTEAVGGTIDFISYCPHLPNDHCLCRKPLPGMIHQIAAHFKHDLKDAIFIGDSFSDYQAAQAANINFALVKTGKGKHTFDNNSLPEDLKIYDDLAHFADQLVVG